MRRRASIQNNDAAIRARVDLLRRLFDLLAATPLSRAELWRALTPLSQYDRNWLGGLLYLFDHQGIVTFDGKRYTLKQLPHFDFSQLSWYAVQAKSSIYLVQGALPIPPPEAVAIPLPAMSNADAAPLPPPEEEKTPQPDSALELDPQEAVVELVGVCREILPPLIQLIHGVAATLEEINTRAAETNRLWTRLLACWETAAAEERVPPESKGEETHVGPIGSDAPSTGKPLDG